MNPPNEAHTVGGRLVRCLDLVFASLGTQPAFTGGQATHAARGTRTFNMDHALDNGGHETIGNDGRIVVTCMGNSYNQKLCEKFIQYH